MTSQIIWELTGTNITKITTNTNKLYANSVASAEYGLIGNDILPTDVVILNATVNGNTYSHKLRRQTITYPDGTTATGWKVVSNGDELRIDLQSGTLEITFNFNIKRFSEVDGTTLVKQINTQSDTAYLYPGETYHPEAEATATEEILEDIADLERRATDLENGKVDKVAGQYTITNDADDGISAVYENEHTVYQTAKVAGILVETDNGGNARIGMQANSVSGQGETPVTKYSHLNVENDAITLRSLTTEDSVMKVEQITVSRDGVNVTGQGFKYNNKNVATEEFVEQSIEDAIAVIDGDIGDLARTKQDKVDNNLNTTDKSVVGGINELKSGLDTNISDIATINSKIPTEASSSNKLADKDFVNSSINSIAAYYITKNAQGQPFATKSELNSATVYYSGGQVRIPTTNDYCIVQADESQRDSITGEDPTTRYSYQRNQWEFQYIVNKTSLTQAQLNALNSGITASDVAQIATNTGNIATNTGNIATLSTTVAGHTASINDLQNNKMSKSTLKEYTLVSTDWLNYSQTLSIDGLTSSKSVRVSNGESGTNDEILANSEAIAEANIYKIVNNGTTLTFTCEAVPTQDLVILVEIYEATILVNE